ncbi:flagellar protein FlaG [Billgrantia gudaonensis]|uniref:Flagellar protein FlaG n=1 Tax=Billgrantia gudaonensis TaxID=376427 RepID=A0A1G8T118_9GAMM|nr:flagellar protein FlaG [Halomonas gudaonensis]SDJ35143.1 flagellar protein FlaG [Halomonas gudaonensis]
MTSPLSDAKGISVSSVVPEATPRERKENVLGALPTAGGNLADAQSHAQAPSQADLVEPVQRVNEVLRQYGVSFEINQESSRVITRIVDQESGEVLRQIPPEEVLAISERLEEFQGRLIDLEA